MHMGPIKRAAILGLRAQIETILNVMGDLESPTQREVQGRLSELWRDWDGKSKVPNGPFLAARVLGDRGLLERLQKDDGVAWAEAQEGIWGYLHWGCAPNEKWGGSALSSWKNVGEYGERAEEAPDLMRDLQDIDPPDNVVVIGAHLDEVAVHVASVVRDNGIPVGTVFWHRDDPDAALQAALLDSGYL